MYTGYSIACDEEERIKYHLFIRIQLCLIELLEFGNLSIADL